MQFNYQSHEVIPMIPRRMLILRTFIATTMIYIWNNAVFIKKKINFTYRKIEQQLTKIIYLIIVCMHIYKDKISKNVYLLPTASILVHHG